jgi:hypothetical protein
LGGLVAGLDERSICAARSVSLVKVSCLSSRRHKFEKKTSICEHVHRVIAPASPPGLVAG